MAIVTERDWYAWHAGYDNPATGLARRLRWVQDRIRAALDDAPPGPLRAISLCAGQGRDLIGVLADHPRRADVTARLVELDPRNTAFARRLAERDGLSNVEIVTGDAARTSAYADLVPADLVIACGLFGNLTNAHIERTIGYCTQLCATGGTVVWTRGRWARGSTEPDLVPQVCEWFEERGFERVWLSDPSYGQCCGAHRFTATPAPLTPDATMFTFTGHDPLRGPSRTA
jgi:Putative methyltransferase